MVVANGKPVGRHINKPSPLPCSRFPPSPPHRAAQRPGRGATICLTAGATMCSANWLYAQSCSFRGRGACATRAPAASPPTFRTARGAFATSATTTACATLSQFLELLFGENGLDGVHASLGGSLPGLTPFGVLHGLAEGLLNGFDLRLLFGSEFQTA